MAAFDERNVQSNLNNPTENNPYLNVNKHHLQVQQPRIISHSSEVKHAILPLAGHYTGVSGWRNQQPELSAVLNMAEACKPHYSCDPLDFHFEMSSSSEYYVPVAGQASISHYIDVLLHNHGITFQNQAHRALAPALMWLMPLKLFMNGLIGYTPEAQDALNKLMELRKGYQPANEYSRTDFQSFLQFATFSGCTDNEWGWYASIQSLGVFMHAWFDTANDAEAYSVIESRIKREIDRMKSNRDGFRAVDGHPRTTTYNPWYFTQASMSNIMGRATIDFANYDLQRRNPPPANSVDPMQANMSDMFQAMAEEDVFDVVSAWDEKIYSAILRPTVNPPVYKHTISELNYLLANKLSCRNSDCMHTLPLNLLRAVSKVSSRKDFSEIITGTYRSTSNVFSLGGDGHGMEQDYRTYTSMYQHKLLKAANKFLTEQYGTTHNYNSVPSVEDSSEAVAGKLIEALEAFGKKLLGKRGFHKDVLERYTLLINIACNRHIVQFHWDDIMSNGNMTVFGGSQRLEWFAVLMSTAVLTHEFMVNGGVYGITVTPDGVQFLRTKIVLINGKLVARKTNYTSSPFLYNTAYNLDMRAEIDNMKCKLNKPMFFNVELDGSDEAYDVVWQVYRTGPDSCMTGFRKESSPLIAYNHKHNDYRIAFTLRGDSEPIIDQLILNDDSIVKEDPLTWDKEVWDSIVVEARALNNGEEYVRAYGDNADATMRTHGLQHGSWWTAGQVLNAVISHGYEEASDVYRLPYFDSNEYCGFNDDGDLIQGIDHCDCVEEVIDCTYTSAEVYVPSGRHGTSSICPHCDDRYSDDSLLEAIDAYGDTILICPDCARRDFTRITDGEYEDMYMRDDVITECADGKIVPSVEVTYIPQLCEEWWDDDLDTCSVTGIVYPSVKMTNGIIDDTEIDNLDDTSADALREHYGLTEEDEE